MITECTDCGTPLGIPYHYVRCLQPGEGIPLERDPLCKSCWKKDVAKVAKAVRAKEAQA